MRTKFSKLLSILLCLVMVVGLLPTVALAEGESGTALPAGPDDMSGTVINVNAENAQYTLDGAYGSIDGKTIVFSTGDYSRLELGRATKYADSNTDYYIGGVAPENKKTYEEFVAIKNNGQWSASAYYVRNMSDVTLKAAEGAEVNIAGLVASSGHVYGNVYDYVLDKQYKSGSAYYLSHKLANITIEGIHFTAKVEFATSSENTEIDGVTFRNCTLTTGGTASDSENGQGLRYYNESNNGKVKNLTVDGCTFTNCYQGIYTQKINGVKVVNSIFDTTGHNAIAVQSGSEAINHKAVVITGNTFTKIGDRIIRFGDVGADTQITIQNNTATDSGDTKGQIMKAQSLAEGITYNICANNWGEGKAAANDELKEGTAVAEVNGLKYTSLEAAIAAANDGDTVTLLADVTLSSTITVLQKTLNLDLNGHTITAQVAGGHTAIDVDAGSLTVLDSSSEKSGKLVSTYYGIMASNGGTIIMQSGTISSARAALCGNNTYGNMNFVVNGGTLTAERGAAIYMSGQGSLTVTGGTLNGGISLRMGQVNISGGTINSTTGEIDSPAEKYHRSSNVWFPDALYVLGGTYGSRDETYGNSLSLNITGGTFNCANGQGSAVAVYDCGAVRQTMDVKISGTASLSTNASSRKAYQVLSLEDIGVMDPAEGYNNGEYIGKVTSAITGGTFSSDPTAYVAGGYIAKKNSETEYAVIARSNLTSGVYMSDPTDYTAANHYVTKNNDGTWTVFYVAPYVAPTYSITVDSAKHGDVTVSPRNASKGDKVTITVESDKGYTLETLTVTDKNGDEIELTNKGDGKYTFTMPAGKVYVEATFMEDNSMLNFFVDVFPGDYYYDAVLWAAKNGITGGVDAAHFAPNATCTRAQAVTFLWRAAGSPAPKSSMMPFTDVPAGSYYAKAVLWAVENGITGGTGNNAFSPDATCSRGQIVSFLWRALGSPAAGTVNPFTDVAADAYYNTAVLWAAENGITGGTGNNAFSPDADCTRAQIVTFLYRCLG